MDAQQGYRLPLSLVKRAWQNADPLADADHRPARPSAMHATFLAGCPQNGTLTTCGMSVTALVEEDNYPGDIPGGDAPTTMARSFIPLPTGNGRARPNMAPPQLILPPTMTISIRATAGRRTTLARGQR